MPLLVLGGAAIALICLIGGIIIAVVAMRPADVAGQPESVSPNSPNDQGQASLDVERERLNVEKLRLEAERGRQELERLRLAMESNRTPTQIPANAFTTNVTIQTPTQSPPAAQPTPAAPPRSAHAPTGDNRAGLLQAVATLKAELAIIQRAGQGLYNQRQQVINEASGVYSQGTAVTERANRNMARMKVVEHGINIRQQVLQGGMVHPDGESAPYNAFGVQQLSNEQHALYAELTQLAQEGRTLNARYAQLDGEARTLLSQIQQKLAEQSAKYAEIQTAEARLPSSR